MSIAIAIIVSVCGLMWQGKSEVSCCHTEK